MSRKCSLKVYNRLTAANITNTRYQIGYRGQSDAQLLTSVSLFGPPCRHEATSQVMTDPMRGPLIKECSRAPARISHIRCYPMPFLISAIGHDQ